MPVSVIIPAHDRADTIGRAVRSALHQKPRPPAEVIVVDDCSTDETAAHARAAGARVIRHDVNRGAGAARNTGIADATQPWIALLDSDDEWLPNHLAALWPHRDAHVLLAGAALQCMPDGAHAYLGTASARGRVVRSPAAIAGRSFFAASGVVVRRDAVRAVGGFRRLYGVEDLDLWLRVLERGTAFASPTVSVLYHLHDDQVSGDGARMQAGHRAVLDSCRSRPWFRARLVHRWEAIVAWDAARAARHAGDRGAVARQLAALVANPACSVELARVLATNVRLRRRTSRYGGSGAPTLALLGDGASASTAHLSSSGGFDVVSPGGTSRLAQWVTLSRRPTSAVLVEHGVDRVLARILGIRAVRAG